MPFDDAMGKLETLSKTMGKPNDLMRKTGNWAPNDIMEHLVEGSFDDAMGKLETLEMLKLGP